MIDPNYGCDGRVEYRQTEEQKTYYKKRRMCRSRLDLRGKELHFYKKDKIHPDGCILEIEQGLLKWWSDWQDQPDEIVVDSITALLAVLGKEPNPRPLDWTSQTYLYRTRFTALSSGEAYIPVFENI